MNRNQRMAKSFSPSFHIFLAVESVFLYRENHFLSTYLFLLVENKFSVLVETFIEAKYYTCQWKLVSCLLRTIFTQFIIILVCEIIPPISYKRNFLKTISFLSVETILFSSEVFSSIFSDFPASETSFCVQWKSNF